MANSQVTKVAATPVFDLISTQTITAGTEVDFTGLNSTYSYYLIKGEVTAYGTPATTGCGVLLYNGSWITSASYYRSLYQTGANGNSSLISSANATGQLVANRYVSNLGSNEIVLKIWNHSSTSYKTTVEFFGTDKYNTINYDVTHFGYVRPESNTEAHTGLRFYPIAGTMTGVFKLYGYY